MASIIASQALISGAFSLTVQAMQLDYLPRLAVLHTSADHQGQVYVPLVNWALMIGSVGLVLGFQTSSNLAAAYGIAVTTTMAITTILFFVVARDRWGWSPSQDDAGRGPAARGRLAFLAANVPKIPHGGWFPLVVGRRAPGADGDVAQGPAARRRPHPPGRALRRPGLRRSRRR